MKIVESEEYNNSFYIVNPINNRNSRDDEIAQYFNLEYDKYIELLKKFGAHSFNGQYYFKTEKQACYFLNSKDLELYLILARLCND